MSIFKRYKIKSILLSIVWSLIGCGSIILLVAAVRKKDQKRCTGVAINITGVSNHYFIDKKDVARIMSMNSGGQPLNKPIEEFDLKKMEEALKKDIWIKDAEMFFDNNGLLQVEIGEREPIARIFTTGGSTFYIDSSLMILPISDKFSARLPVFTGFPSEARVLNKADSILLTDIRNVAELIQKDSFLMGIIEQVDITAQRSFEMIPKIGNQIIVFGDGSDAVEKFHKLSLFYKNIPVKTGWNYYSVINLQYKGQIVGKIRGADDVSADSLRTVQMMAVIAAYAESMAADSLKTLMPDSDKLSSDSTMIQQSIQRDETSEAPLIPESPESVKAAIVKETPKVQVSKQKTEIKPNVTLKKQQADIKKPKAVMEKKSAIKNEY